MRANAARAALVGLLLGCLLLANCRPAGEERADHAFTVAVEDGVTISTTFGRPRYEGELFRYENVLEIRGDDAVPDSLLVEPTWIARGEDGTVLIADQGQGHVVVYNETASYVRTIGRAGQGPGEFGNVYSVHVDGQVVTVLDGARRKLHEFTATGQHSKNHPFPVVINTDETNWHFSGPKVWLAAGGVSTVAFLIENTTGPATRLRGVVRTQDDQGNSLAEITGTWVDRDATATVTLNGVPEPMRLTLRFAGYPDVAYSREHGIYMTNGIDGEVVVYDLAGSIERRLRLQGFDQEITDGDRLAAQAALDQAYETALSPPPGTISLGSQAIERARARRDNPRFASRRALWLSIDVDDRGFVWLGRPDASGSQGLKFSPTEYWILSPEGEFLGTTRPPSTGQATTGHFLTLESDPDTFEHLPTVYRIHPQVEGLRY